MTFSIRVAPFSFNDCTFHMNINNDACLCHKKTFVHLTTKSHHCSLIMLSEPYYCRALVRYMYYVLFETSLGVLVSKGPQCYRTNALLQTSVFLPSLPGVELPPWKQQSFFARFVYRLHQVIYFLHSDLNTKTRGFRLLLIIYIKTTSDNLIGCCQI